MERFFKKNKQPAEKQQRIILDTNGLIDGRIVDVAKAGFIPENIIIPQFVIAELQFLADKADSQKRERARFGLDIIRELQDLRNNNVVIAREKFPNIKEVDDKLVALAKQYRAPLYTIDYNLNKVAQIEGVTVLNVNELAQALRPHHLPGEKATVKLVQPGQDSHQAVGYLEDGTMVVVEQGRKHIGNKVDIVFTRMLQTQAGKMTFATVDKQQKGGRDNKPQAGNKPRQQAQPDQKQPAKPAGNQQQQQQRRRPNQERQHNNQQKGQGRRPQNRRRDHPEDKLISLINDSES